MNWSEGPLISLQNVISPCRTKRRFSVFRAFHVKSARAYRADPAPGVVECAGRNDDQDDDVVGQGL